MGACSVEKLECTPEFDMMGFMELSQETRVDGKVMSKMTSLWDEWLKKLSVYKVVCGKISYLLVWLPEEVETYVDEAYRKDFSALHSSLLSQLLPLDDFILSREVDGRIMARERMDGRVYTIFLSQEGLIMALQI